MPRRLRHARLFERLRRLHLSRRLAARQRYLLFAVRLRQVDDAVLVLPRAHNIVKGVLHLLRRAHVQQFHFGDVYARPVKVKQRLQLDLSVRLHRLFLSGQHIVYRALAHNLPQRCFGGVLDGDARRIHRPEQKIARVLDVVLH